LLKKNSRSSNSRLNKQPFGFGWLSSLKIKAMAKRFYPLLLMITCFAHFLLGQNDSLEQERKFFQLDSLIHAERLGYSDVQVPLTRQSDKIKIISGSRFPIESDDLP
jgi:hypothetical protein